MLLLSGRIVVTVATTDRLVFFFFILHLCIKICVEADSAIPRRHHCGDSHAHYWPVAVKKSTNRHKSERIGVGIRGMIKKYPLVTQLFTNDGSAIQ